MRDFLYCLVFPHPRNNHRASVLHFKTLSLVTLFFLFSSLFFPSHFNPLGSRIRAFADISVKELINFTNQEREKNGLADLLNNSQLTEAATKKADDMFAKNYWAHNAPDGTTPWIFIKDSGYNYVYAGENLARGFNSAGDVVNAWMASPEHRENILSPNFKDVGFAVEEGKLNGEDTFLVVEEFGSKSLAPVVDTSKNSTQTESGVKKVLGFNVSSYLTNKPTFSVSSQIAILVVVLFIAVFFLDMIVIQRKNVVRFVGHNVDHIIFLTVIVSAIVVLNTAAII